MNKNIKEQLNIAFDGMTEKLADFDYKSTPVSVSAISEQKRLPFKRKLVSVAALVLTVFVAVFSISHIEDKSSKITCVILDIAPTVQIVVEDGNILSVDALDPAAASFVQSDALKGIEGKSLSEGVEIILEAAYSLGYINDDDNKLEVKAINNNNGRAADCLASFENYAKAFSSKTRLQLVLDKTVLDYDDYNELVFGEKGVVDDLDKDKNEVINPQ